ncbi:MAG: EF-P lysine aminoacylase EpmA [Gammaproteobacteria bacterium]|nr:EF-P lysine aminoacylase EpmA [Gammaproteobacteria bacterium]
MDWRPTATPQTIRSRARLYQKIRAFFATSDCLEVDTPLLSVSTNTDPNIASIVADVRLYLQTSPEFAMKRLLAAGSGSIYQICHAFRAGERGSRHRSEFTLLEWYRVGFDYRQLMDEMERLINSLSDQKNQFLRVSYTDLFKQHLGVDIDSVELIELRNICSQRIPGTDSEQLTFDECLDLLISLLISPLMEGYVFVTDYPLSQASLARVSERNPKFAERFELYYNGLELANGFSELTDASVQRQRFLEDNLQRQKFSLPEYPLDERFLSALAAGLPDCAGVALGLDRLLMVLLELDSIDQVMSFSD